MSEVMQHRPQLSRMIALAVVIGAASVGWLFGHFSDGLKWSLNHQIFADNRTTTTICLVLAGLYISHLHCAPVMHMRRQIGFIVVCVSLAAHREIWAWWRWYLGHNDKAAADWIRDDLAWLTSVFQLGIWFGFGLIMTAFVWRYYENRADWMVASGVIGCWSFWFLLSAGMS